MSKMIPLVGIDKVLVGADLSVCEVPNELVVKLRDTKKHLDSIVMGDKDKFTQFALDNAESLEIINAARRSAVSIEEYIHTLNLLNPET